MPPRGRSALGFLLSALCLASPAYGIETLRIAVGPPSSELRIRGESLAWGEDDENASYSPIDEDEVVVRWRDKELWMGGAHTPKETVRIRSRGAKGALTVGSFTVQGDIVVIERKGQLVAINVVPLEDYVSGVLGGEMPASFPEEALKAQAVAARTYAMRKKTQQFGADFHLGSSVLHQVYAGLSNVAPRVRVAVKETQGLLLTYSLEPIEAYFHSTCGGETETGAAALGRDLPYLRSVNCPCEKSASSRWRVTFSTPELRKLLGAAEPKQMEVTAKTDTGRAKAVRLSSKRVLDAVTLRQKLGYGKIKSLLFEVKAGPSSDEVTFSGKGFGHGAGMCQWGAKALAERGQNFREILEHYYPGAELLTLY